MGNESEFLPALPTRRVATRYVLRIGVILRVGERGIEGTIVDVSASGVLVECAAPAVAPGANVAVEFGCFDFAGSVRMLAVHVRDTATGCALRFADTDPFLRLFVKLVRLHEEARVDPLDELLAES